MEVIKEIAKDIFKISISQQQLLIRTLFSSELDFVTKLLSFACITFIALEILYLILPRGLQVKLEALDYKARKESGGFSDLSTTAGLASLSGFILVIFILQKHTSFKLTPE